MPGLSDLAGLLNIGGLVAGAIGQGKNSQQALPQSGFGTRPKAVQDYMMEVLFPEIKKLQNTPYQGIPKRRITAEDLDPIFGSRARQDIQGYKDTQAAPKTVDAVKSADGSYSVPSDVQRGMSVIQGAAGGNKFNLCCTSSRSGPD